jgi:restriction system protein
MHEIFTSDTANVIDVIVLNGIVTGVDRSSGNHVTTCVLSIQADREQFLAINLEAVDPKACFRSLRGVGSPKLHGLTAIPPIMDISREDRRFIDSYAVAGGLDATTNLAAMPWEDFEHLIREVFEKEFAANGGEVRVTQASRDGGVDAIAFDPDPIRGGKIVIQALHEYRRRQRGT